jgi:hypothetical protein
LCDNETKSLTKIVPLDLGFREAGYYGPGASQKVTNIDMLITTLMFRPFYFGRATAKYDNFYHMAKRSIG